MHQNKNKKATKQKNITIILRGLISIDLIRNDMIKIRPKNGARF